jgi:predicted nuclease of predicted toxin-antitoxin system
VRLLDFAFLADENIHPEVVAYLRAQGIDVVCVSETNMAAADDADLLHLAVSENRVVLTHDRDFGTLAVARQEPLVGVIYLRPGHIQAQFTIESVRALLAAKLDLQPPFLLVARRRGSTVSIRLRYF